MIFFLCFFVGIMFNDFHIFTLTLIFYVFHVNLSSFVIPSFCNLFICLIVSLAILKISTFLMLQNVDFDFAYVFFSLEESCF
jgi:hypothetical protein